jgi:hypothetical protein
VQDIRDLGRGKRRFDAFQARAIQFQQGRMHARVERRQRIRVVGGQPGLHVGEAEARIERRGVALQRQGGDIGEVRRSGVVERERHRCGRRIERCRQCGPGLRPARDIAVQSQDEAPAERELAARAQRGHRIGRGRAAPAQHDTGIGEQPDRVVEQQWPVCTQRERHARRARFPLRGDADPRRLQPQPIGAETQRAGQHDPSRQSPVAAALHGDPAARGEARAGVAQQGIRIADRDGEVGGNRQRRVEVARAQPRVQRFARGQARQVELDAVDRPVVVVEAAVGDAHAVGEGRQLRLLRGRARGEPVLQRGQVDARGVQFQAPRREHVAARADRRPGHGHHRAVRVQQFLRCTWFAHREVSKQQHRRPAQAVFGDARGADLEPQRTADAVEEEATGTLWLQHRMQREPQQQGDADGDCAENKRAPRATILAGARARGGAHAAAQPPSAAGSSASTKACASNTRRSSGRSPMPA